MSRLYYRAKHANSREKVQSYPVQPHGGGLEERYDPSPPVVLDESIAEVENVEDGAAAERAAGDEVV